jgi:hypothetical protein
MDKKEIKSQAEAFCANPRVYRKSAEGQAEFAQLAPAVQAKVREVLEARRGFRRVNGVIEFDETTLAGEIARLKDKKATLAAREELLDSRIAELEAEQAERFGAGSEAADGE